VNPRRILALALLLAGCSGPPGRATGHRTTSSPTVSLAAPPSAPAAPLSASVIPAKSSQHPLTAGQLLAGGDPTDATAVAGAFARLSWSLDTAADSSEVAAEARLAPLMTPELAAQVRAGGASHAGATFLLWRSHQASTVARVQQTFDSGAPADTAVAAYRSFVITVVPTGRDGWTGPSSTQVEFLTLSRPAAGLPWLIANVA
jgi:hypothetical protein